MTVRARLTSLGRSGGRPKAPGRRAAAAEEHRVGASHPRDHERGHDERAGADTFEWRMRASDGPVDLGHYGCACGYQFAAPVETAVRCPHCGADQAW
jgi:hypothetical protein